MAQQKLNLAQLKHSGVYTLEFDETVSYNVETSALRLLVGFNPKGPFNKPVFLADDEDRRKVFGDIDQKLEQKGSFFGRMAQTLLQRSPIFALNLLKVNENVTGPDQVNYAALSLDAGTPNPAVASFNKKKYGEAEYNVDIDQKIYGSSNLSLGIPYIGNAPYAQMFDRSRFWDPSDENLLATAANGLGTGDTTTFEKTNFLNFANVGTEEFSLLIFKPEALTGYDITAREWYGGKENIPYGFIRPSDYISDYFIQVVAVKGNWTNYPELSVDPLWSDFFDKNGIRKNKINSFMSAEGVVLIGSWQGCIIPDFQDKVGNPENIVDKINNSTLVTGILASFNKDAATILRYDYDGETDEDGNVIKERGWFTDLDGDGEINEGESLGSSYYIDMVGHNFQKGYDTGIVRLTKKASWYDVDSDSDIPNEFDHEEIDEDGNTFQIYKSVKYWESAVNADGEEYSIPIYENERRYGINFLSYNYDADTDTELTEPIRYAKLFNKFYDPELSVAPVTEDIKNMFIVANKDEADKLEVGDLVNNDTTDENIIPGLTKITGKTWLPLIVDEDTLETFVNGTVKVEGATYTYKGESYLYSGYAIYDAQFGMLGVYLYTTIESVGVTTVNENGAISNLDYAGTYSVIGLLDGQEFVKISSYNGNPNAIREANGDYQFATGNYKISYANYNDEITEATLRFYITAPEGNPNATAKVFYTYKPTEDSECVTLSGDGAVQEVIIDSNRKFRIEAGNGVKVFLAIESFEAAPEFVITTEEDHVIKQHTIADDLVSSHLKFIPLKGLKVGKRHMPGYDANGNIGFEQGVEKIYSVLKEGGVYRGLMNQQMINFRYIIDSMSYGLDGMLGGKVYLSQLAQAKGKTLAILNAPSKREFARSTNPYFCDTFVNGVDIKPAFDTAYIPKGGNDKIYASKKFSLPDSDNGASYSCCVFPNLIYSVGGRSFSVPPAADIANVLIRKFTGGDPYMICANNNGVISNPYVIGIEYALDDFDRDALEPFGINPIITRDGTIMLYGNQTCYQRVKSDLNKLHIRENLNTIEIECDAVLQNYVFLYNNPQTRADIVQKLTPVLDSARTSGAIDSYTIQCDERNNTEEIIVQDIGIVDITVVMNHGMEKIVNRITLRRNGVSQKA